MPAPHLTTLTPASARIFADWLAGSFGTEVAGQGVAHSEYGDTAYRFPFADGTTGEVWFYNGSVYGEA